MKLTLIDNHLSAFPISLYVFPLFVRILPVDKKFHCCMRSHYIDMPFGVAAFCALREKLLKKISLRSPIAK